MLKIKTLPSKKKEVLEILQSMHQPLRTTQGCMEVHVYESHTEPNSILYVEYWTTKQILHRHIQSDLFLRVLTAMELAQETPKIEFYEFSSLPGMDLIHRLREGGFEAV